MEAIDGSPGQIAAQPTDGTGGAVQPVACERAPTLMAGEVAGSQGSVQVWSPDEMLLRKHSRRAVTSSVLYFGTPLALIPVVLLAMQGVFSESALLFIFFTFIPMMLGAGLSLVTHMGAPAARRRPRYLTTDDSGMGVTLQRDSRYLRWDEIISALRSPVNSEIILWNRQREKIRLNLSGYQKSEQDAIWKLIATNTSLAPCGSWFVLSSRDWRVLPGYRISGWTGQIISGAALPAPGQTPALPRKTG